MKKKDNSTNATLLRCKAEALLNKKKSTSDSQRDGQDLARLIHELQVHQIELELQNQELMIAQTAAQDAADKYVELYDFAPSGYVSLTENGEICHINLTGARMLGKERSQLLHRQIQFFIAEESRTTFSIFLINVFDSIVKEMCDVTVSAYSGAQLFVHLTGIVSENGDQCLMTMVDITERKLAEDVLHEHQLRLLEANRIAHVGTWELTVSSGKIWASDETFTMYGATQNALREMNIDSMEACMVEKTAAHQALVDLMYADASYDIEIEITPPHGASSRFLHSIAHCIRDGKNNPIKVVGVVQDVTTQKNSERILRDVQRRESLGILSGGIAHDFNNLLGTMMGNVSLAQAQLPLEHPAEKNLEKALSAMDRAAKLTQQMLAYSGKGKFQISTIDLAVVIQEHVNMFTVSLPKNVKLITHLPPMHIFINGDPGQIEQIIMNLIINGGDAIGEVTGIVSVVLTDATPEGADLQNYGRITNTNLGEGRYAMIEIRDDGSGMSRDTMEKIFDPFFTTKFTGRGLGLSAVLGIIRGHKGGITVESAEGRGTTIRVILPATTPPVTEENLRVIDGQLTAGRGATILVIDDEQDVATMAQDILEMQNFTVLVETNPIRGVELYSHHATVISAVLLDMTMPEMSGKEVAMALHAITPDLKIIISSGYSEEEVLKKMGAATVSGFIQKPYRAQALLSLMHGVLQ